MNGYNTALRCFKILEIEGYFAILEISKLYNVSIRTIKRDIRFLRTLGYLIIYVKDKGYLNYKNGYKK